MLKLPSGATMLSLVPSHHNYQLVVRIGTRLEPDHVVASARASAVDQAVPDS